MNVVGIKFYNNILKQWPLLAILCLGTFVLTELFLLPYTNSKVF